MKDTLKLFIKKMEDIRILYANLLSLPGFILLFVVMTLISMYAQ